MSDPVKAARRLLAEVEEATQRAEASLHRARTRGGDHFQANLDMARHQLQDSGSSLDHYRCQASALAAGRA